MMRSTSSFSAVSRMMGTFERWARKSLQTSSPDPSGSMTSSTTRSTCCGAPPLGTLSEMLRAAAADGVIDPQHQDGPDDRDQHAPDIESGNAARAEHVEEITADHGADNAEHHIHQDAL